MSDLQESFALELAQISRRWRAKLDERLKHTGLTQSRWNTLLQLSRGGNRMTQRDLAERLGIEGPTLVRLIDALERQGLVERCPVRGDRRAWHIRLTAAAKPILREINRIAADLRCEILAEIPAGALGQCLGVLRRVRRRLEVK